MRHVIVLVLLAASGAVFAAEETRELPPFNAILSQGAYRLTVNVGQTQAVVLSGAPEILESITTQVTGDVLKISMQDNKKWGWKDKVSITINLAELRRLRMEGVGDTALKNVSGEDFSLQYQGVGSLKAQGNVKRFELRAEGVGTINARELEAQDVDARLQGVGSVKVHASASLRAKVEGLGSLTYYGKPKQVSQSTEGIGSVRAGD